MPHNNIRLDTNNEFKWDSIESLYNDADELQSRSTIFDNGVLRVEIPITNDLGTGLTSTMTLTDNSEANDFAWDVIQTTFAADGSTVAKSTTYDNGITRVADFTDGALTTITRLDNPGASDGGAKAWDSIVSTFDASGNISSDSVVNDNGTSTVTTYNAEGTRTGAVKTDNQTVDGSDLNTWDTVALTYDGAGNVTERTTTYDNGVVRVDTFTDGVRSSVTMTDNPGAADDGVKSWASQQTTYDAAGNITQKSVVADDGTETATTFLDGNRATVVMTDSLLDGGFETWESITSTYDATGEITQKTRVDDDGSTTIQGYTDGALTAFSVVDSPVGAGNEIWDRIDTTYASDGTNTTTTTLTTYDDGVESLDVRVDGVRTQRVDTDNSADGSARIWTTSEDFFDATGEISGGRIVYDNADQFAFTYVDGSVTQQVQFDGDDSQSWMFRVKDITVDGPVVTTYDTMEDAPVEITSLFIEDPLF